MATLGIISIGEMGLGIGQLLKAHGYRVVTNATGRSELTKSRAQSAEIELLSTDEELVQQCDYILSIVPPRDALKTAERILHAANALPKSAPLWFLDLNAVSPRTARQTARIFEPNPNIKLIDGGIIGGVPYQKPMAVGSEETSWHCPSLIVSGPDRIPDQRLAEILNIHHLNETIGSATGLKMCFAVTTKGFVSLAIESFTTAHNLGVLPELRDYLGKYNPSTLSLAEKGLVTMPPKAYRWVHEMLEIAETMEDDGGFSREIFQGVAEVYRVVAEDSELGKEKPGHRARGKTVEDVVELLSQGMEAKKLKTE
ncbi:6-phosphogluconate dehydrogenase [Xylogone sp. PMI_703]|nr:6-phosphogluconate dehydrogenase [Xylogone sp. PMI_703]